MCAEVKWPVWLTASRCASDEHKMSNAFLPAPFLHLLLFSHLQHSYVGDRAASRQGGQLRGVPSYHLPQYLFSEVEENMNQTISF